MLSVPAEPFRAMVDGSGPLELTAIDFHPLEPSNYCWDPGWTCVSDDGIEFFVNQAGDVFVPMTTGESARIGSVAVLRAAADEMERQAVAWETAWERRYIG